MGTRYPVGVSRGESRRFSEMDRRDSGPSPFLFEGNVDSLTFRSEISSENRFRRVLAILGIPGIVFLKMDIFSSFAMTPRGGNLFLMKDMDKYVSETGQTCSGRFPEAGGAEYFNWFCESAVKMKECFAKHARMPVG